MGQIIAAETWQIIDDAFVKRLAPITREQALLYFDGAVPRWEHSVSPSIPKRHAAETIISRFSARSPKQGGCSLQLIRGAGGEGKTTILLQVAATLTGTGFWKVLWRTSANLRFALDALSHSDDYTQWLVVADDAENLIADVRQAAMKLSQKGTSNIHFLLAARDSDWRFSRGDQVGWDAWLKRYSDIYLRNATEEDARRIVGAWRNCGAEAMGALEIEKDPDKQVRALVNAINDAAHSQSEGSLFGGLLRVRFGPAGLRSHVISLLERLRSMPIEHSSNKSNLFDALLYVAACHGVGIPGIDANVLADLVGVERGRVQSLVIRPMGEEAAAVQNIGNVLTRHRDIAAAILVAAEQNFDVDIAEIWSAIVQQTVLTSRDLRIGPVFSDIVRAGTRLQRELPKQFSEPRRKEIAIAAAKADVVAEPDRVCALVDLGKTYRTAGRLNLAVNMFRENHCDVSKKTDFLTDARGYWVEWGMCEENQNGPLASIWLCGIALSDHLQPADLGDSNLKVACGVLGRVAGSLAQARADCPFARLRRAAASLRRFTIPDSWTAHFSDKYDREADKIGTPRPRNIEEAIDWLTNAISEAGRKLQDPVLTGLLNPDHVSFTVLREGLSSTPVPHPSPRHTTPPSTPKPQPIVESKPLQLRIPLEVKVQNGITRVLKEAWENMPEDTSPERQFAVAQRKAADAITRLSPHIKRQVSAHFHKEKWESLKAYAPKR